MKIFSTEQTRELDAYTIAQEPISSLNLMERASNAFVKTFIQNIDKTHEIYIFCGVGNNGGDGLAVARLLLGLDYTVRVFILKFSQNLSPDFQANYQRLANLLENIEEIHQEADFPLIAPDTVIIDAIFGSGLNREIEGITAQLVQYLNARPNPIVSIDIASGLFADKHTPSENIIKPTLTIAFQFPKLAFVLPQNADFVGEWKHVPIGLHSQKIEEMPTQNFFIDQIFAQKLLRKRGKFSHKGSHGKALLIVGSYGKMGAGVLSARACLRAGAGLLTVYVPKSAYNIMQIAVPEAMVMTDTAENFIQSPLSTLNEYGAFGIGCGLSQTPATLNFVGEFLEKSTLPVIIDADAINLIAQHQDLLVHLPPNSIFTPHPKEFERLVGKANNDFERLEKMREFAQKYQAIILLKGAHTAIASPDGSLYFNSTGNAGMATAGSGDVLAGILTGLLAQGYSPLHTTILGVFLHGLAGDFAKKKYGENAMIASDIIENLGNAFLALS